MQQAARAIRPGRNNTSSRVPRKILAFQQVAARGERKLIEWFVREEGVKVDSRDRNLNTALMFAAANGEDLAIVNLMHFGADINAKNRLGQTPLMFAAANGHMGTVRMLLEHRAKGHLKDNEGKRASNHARENGHYEVGRIIEQHQESLNESARDAVRRGSAGELDYYLCKGADPASLGPALDF